MGWDILTSRITRRYFPFSVQIAVTNRCNARCQYCNYYNRESKDLPLESIINLIDDLKSLGTKRISLVGGEPLVRSDIFEIIEHIAKRDISSSLISNGYLVPQYIDKLRNLSSLVISLDGPHDLHEKNREKGSFEKVIYALDVAKKNNIPTRISSVLTKYNSSPQSIDFLAALGKKYDAKIAVIIMQNVKETANNIETLKAKDEQYRETLRRVIEEIRKGGPFVFSQMSFNHALSWPDYSKVRILAGDDSLNEINGPACWGGKYFVNIDSNGDVYPCCLTIKEIDALNFCEVGFEKAWKHLWKHSCKTCMSPCWTEYNYIFSLRPEVLLHQLKTTSM